MTIRKILLLAAMWPGGGWVQAQSQLPPTTGRWLLGLQAAAYPRLALLPDQAGGKYDYGYGPLWPVQLVVRYQGTSAVGAEAGLLLRLTSLTTSTPTSAGNYTIHRYGHSYLVPLVMRLKLAPRHSTRWQLDAVVGLLLASTTYKTESTWLNTQTGATESAGSSSFISNDAPLLGGLGVTCYLTPRWALTADARLSWSYLNTFVGQLLLRDGSYAAPLLPAVSMGVAYRFGPAKP